MTASDEEAYNIIEGASTKSGYYWPDFGVTEKAKNGEIEVELLVFDVKKGIFTGQYKGYNKIVEFYDTPELYKYKILAIDNENRLRTRENNHRREREEQERKERERAREEREEDRDPNGFDIFLDVVDLTADIVSLAIDYELKMIPHPEFKPSIYHDQNEFECALIKNSIDNAFNKYISRFDGITDSGTTTTGTGRFRFLNGDIYEGQWENSKAQGNGTYRYSSGAVYTGTFNEGYAQGHGVYVDIDFNKFEGEWEKGEKQGKGEYTFNDGTLTSVVCEKGNYTKMKFKKNVNYKGKMKYTKYIRGRIGRNI